MAARALGGVVLNKIRVMAPGKSCVRRGRSFLWSGWITVAICTVLYGCVAVPFPYSKSESLNREFLEDFPPELRVSNVSVLAFEQRARLIDNEGCNQSWELGCGHESGEQIIEAPIFALGKDIERIVNDTRLNRIQGAGLFVGLIGMGAGAGEVSRSGSRLKVLAIITQHGSVFCTRLPIENNILGRLFKIYKVNSESRDGLVVALQTTATHVTLPLVPGSCELSGAFAWSDVERKRVIDFLKTIPVGLAAPSNAQPTVAPSEPLLRGAQ